MHDTDFYIFFFGQLEVDLYVFLFLAFVASKVLISHTICT